MCSMVIMSAALVCGFVYVYYLTISYLLSGSADPLANLLCCYNEWYNYAIEPFEWQLKVALLIIIVPVVMNMIVDTVKKGLSGQDPELEGVFWGNMFKQIICILVLMYGSYKYMTWVLDHTSRYLDV